MSRPRRVLVVGGSQAGLMTALALSAIGHEVVVLERSAAPLEDRGAGIHLHSSLLALLDEHLDHDIRASSTCTPRQQFLRGDDVVLSEPCDFRFASWGSVYRTLRQALPPSVRYVHGAHVVGFTQGVDEVEVRLEGGGTESADLAVFADGIASTGRRLLGIDRSPEYAGYVVWRGCVPAARLGKAAQRLFDGTHTTCLLGGSHMNLYRVPSATEGSLVNYVWYRAVPAGDELRRLLTDRGGHLRSGSLPPGAMTDEARAATYAAADDLPGPVREVVLATDEPFLQVIFDLDVEQMAFGRACILGDAACVARPHLGAGTAKAAENAWALGRELQAAGGDVAAALAKWDASEVALGRSVLRRSRELGIALQGDRPDPAELHYAAAVAAPLRQA